MTPEIVGTMMGLAASSHPESRLKRALEELGVTTNKVHGEWTGVSFARYAKVYNDIHGCMHASDAFSRGHVGFHSDGGSGGGRRASHAEALAARAGVSVLLQFAWEKATSKHDILAFLLALDKHSPAQILVDGFATDAGMQKAWAEGYFSAASDEGDEAMEKAALSLLDPRLPDTAFASSFERLAAGMSAVHAFRTPVRLQRHCYKEGREVPDCVEVCVRELIEILIYDPSQRRFEHSRLPRTTLLSVRNFFVDLAAGKFAAHSGLASQAWYPICQELPVCEYLVRAPGGEKYELKPTMQNLSRALGSLLWPEDRGISRWTRLEDAAQQWNSTQAFPRTNVAEKRVLHRSLTNEDAAPQVFHPCSH